MVDISEENKIALRRGAHAWLRGNITKEMFKAFLLAHSAHMPTEFKMAISDMKNEDLVAIAEELLKILKDS